MKCVLAGCRTPWRFGGYQPTKVASQPFGWFVRQAMEGNVIQIFEDGGQLRDYVFVDDIVTAMLRCAEADSATGEVVNVGSGALMRFQDMVSTVIRCVNGGTMDCIPWPGNYERVGAGDITEDISKLTSLTAWQPRYTLEEGIQRTSEYYSKYAQHYV